MATENNPKKRAMLDFNTHITVLVGEEKKSFVVHEGIITNHSRFFRAACSGNFNESQDRVVPLPEVEPELFSIYLQHVYTGEVVVASPEAAIEDKGGEERYSKLAELYVVADKLDDLRLRNAILDSIIQMSAKVGKLPSSEAIRIAYTDVPESSLLRKLIRDFYTSKEYAKWLQQVRSEVPADFIFDLACAAGRGTRPKDQSRCEYHEHNDEVPKCSD